jgi:hypothetical protein
MASRRDALKIAAAAGMAASQNLQTASATPVIVLPPNEWPTWIAFEGSSASKTPVTSLQTYQF